MMWLEQVGDKMDPIYRRIYILQNNEWYETRFDQIRTGQIFKLYEPDGTPIVDKKGHDTFKAYGDAFYVNSISEYGISAEPISF